MPNLTSKQYEERAQLADAQAQEAKLAKVKERAQRAAATWRSLAARARLVEVDRNDRHK
jgi:hypothetical protein